MSNQELKPCPICGGACKVVRKPWGAGHVSTVFCGRSACLYKLKHKQATEAVRLHNSIPRGEKCRWRRVLLPNDFFCNDYWKPGCAPDATFLGSYEYCPHCGKKIEERITRSGLGVN